ncbi:MAG: nitrilase-related carbon-nitrogen hydrolase [Fimbriimonas sp.]|nr:nitrilase-related carbon-nitrogen hydrolase [Fimbriimonas sp.]
MIWCANGVFQLIVLNLEGRRIVGVLVRIAWLLGASFVSGCLIVLALPPSGRGTLAWFAMTPVFLASRRTRFVAGFVSALGACAVASIASVTGVFYSLGDSNGVPEWTYVGMALFGFVFGTLAGLNSEIRVWNFRTVLGLAAIGVLLESILLWVLPAPFELSQAGSMMMLWLAGSTGIWGVGFALWFVNLVLANSDKSIAFRGVACATFIGLLYLVNVIALRTERHADDITVGVVQSSSTSLSEMRSLSRLAESGGAILVVWPEFSGIMDVRNGDSKILRALAHEKGMPAFVTSFRDEHEPLPHNAASLFDRSGESKRYFKRKLFAAEKQMHAPGTHPLAVSTPFGQLGLNICYDSCFPAVMRDTAREGADVIALPTIDPESPYGFFAANHAAFGAFRSAEEGLSIIRSDGGAYSTITNNQGVIVGQLGAVADRVLVASVPSHSRWTLYKWAGDWFLYLCGAIVVWAVWPWLAKVAKGRSKEVGSFDRLGS